MQTTGHPFQPHWFPVQPSWIISGALVVLAVLPHQIPAACRRILLHPIGGIIWLAGVVWLFKSNSPVLAMALLVLQTGAWLASNHEGFTPIILNKDKVRPSSRKWLGEEILSEDPIGIQERTEAPQINYDEVTTDEARPWFVESSLEENPVAIQNRPISTNYYEGDTHSHTGGCHT